MRRITRFWTMCIKCRENSLVNHEVDFINKAIIFHCFNCQEAEALVVEDIIPPVDKQSFKNNSKRFVLDKSKDIKN
jgi:transcription elongation factor Elf1